MSRMRSPSPWPARRPLAVAALILALGAHTPALALECPAPQPGGQDVIRESAEDIAALSAMLASGDLGNRIPLIVDGLRRRHPAARTSEIVNYLLTAYCPVVAARVDLDEGGMRAQLDAFASQVTTLATRP